MNNRRIFTSLFLFFIPFLLSAKTIYINPTTTEGANDGTSWANPYLNLQTGLDAARSGDTVYVAAGTYFPTTTTDRYARIQIPANITLVGGFNGAAVFPQFGAAVTPDRTIFSGDIGVEGDSLDNSFTIASAILTPADTLRIEQIYFEHGNANSQVELDGASDFPKSGGGLFIKQTDQYSDLPPAVIELERVIFQNNFAVRNGGAILVQRNVLLDFNQVQFINNQANSGGGVYKVCREREGDLHRFRQIRAYNNVGFTGRGSVLHLISEGDEDYEISGAFYDNQEMPLRLANDMGNSDYTLRVNLANNRTINLNGGEVSGIRLSTSINSAGNILLEDCVFSGQATTSFTDGFGSDNVTVSMNRCVFDGNQIGSNNYTIGIHNNFTITNSIFTNNSGGLLALRQPNVRGLIENCTFLENSSNDNGEYQLFALLKAENALKIRNCIIRDNKYNQLNRPGDLMHVRTGYLLLENNLIYPMSCEALREDPSQTEQGIIECENNIFAEPLFIPLPDHPYPYFLSACSPGANEAATPLEASAELQEVAFNFRNRNYNGVDIGAMENYDFAVIAEYQGLQATSCESVADAAVDFSLPLENTTVYWQNEYNETGSRLDSLRAGQYQFFFTAGSCRDSFIINIPMGTGIIAEPNISDISCHGQQDGVISLAVSGGTSPFSYAWNNGHTTSSATNLPAGEYTITIEDVNGCVTSIDTTLTEPTPLDVSGQITNATNGSTTDGTVLITNIEGGTSPYQLKWNTGSTDSLLQNLAAADYILTVTDANGCVYSEGFAVSISTATNNLSAAAREVTILPNPISMNDKFLIDSKLDVQQVTVFSVNGQPLKVITTTSQADYFMAKRGIFLFKIDLQNGETVWRKVVVQ